MITDISLENFVAFKKLELQFTPGINIIIGENSCGKTQLLKAIYALSSNQDITEKLLSLYKPSSGKLSGIFLEVGKGKQRRAYQIRQDSPLQLNLVLELKKQKRSLNLSISASLCCYLLKKFYLCYLLFKQEQ
ncbi:AAA family ATPase [Psychromonas sp. KJ10-10]|uniref:AAA family ATPase n=1 Tax=Psychromonas sp. KJ10-10 TaxID=3391823 RepID=UPI0039B36F62